MASLVEIANFGLSLCGAARIADLTDASPQARAVNACLETIRQAELSSYEWAFAIVRVQLAVTTDPQEGEETPLFGPPYQYDVPVDFLRLASPDQNANVGMRDWRIEGRRILTNYGPPLEVRYVRDVTDGNLMHPLFRMALSAKIGHHVCEELTGSNTKRQILMEEYDRAIKEAKRVNAIMKPPADPALDDWILTRGIGGRDNSRGWA